MVRIVLGTRRRARNILNVEVETNLEENHGGNLLGREGLPLAEVVHLNLGVAAIVNDLEGPGLNVLLDGGVVEAATDQTPAGQGQLTTRRRFIRGYLHSLGIEDGVTGVHGSIVLGRLTNQTLLVGEGDERGGGEGTLLVGNDFDIAAFVGSDTRVGGTCSETQARRLAIEARRNRARAACRDHKNWRVAPREKTTRRQNCATTWCGQNRQQRLTQVDANGSVIHFVRHFQERDVRRGGGDVVVEG